MLASLRLAKRARGTLSLPRLVRYGEILFDNFAILVGVSANTLKRHPPKQVSIPHSSPPMDGVFCEGG